MKYTSTILIVDDEQGARDTLEALLLSEGYNLAFASSGAEALEKSTKLTPSLILLDVMMPEMDGFEVCRRLRSIPLLAEIPIIMVTALDDRDSRLQGIEAGADDFISKPFDFGELRARVQTITRLDRYRRLLQERIKFEWVIRQAEDGYLIVDIDDKILYANFRARLYLSLPSSPSEQVAEKTQNPISSETFLELAQKQYHLEPREAWLDWSGQSAGSSIRYLVRPETQTAEAFWLQVESLELLSEPYADKILRLRDVTAQIVSQRNRRGFHTMICHKLRTPLVGLLGSLGFMVHHASTLSHNEVSEFSEMALKSVQRLHGEIEDILQYLSAPSVSKTGENMFKLSQLQALATQIGTNLELESVMVSVQEGLNDAWILFSQQAVELTMWEILENSKKFHPQQDPTVEITVSHSDSKYVSIRIEDDGLSLSPNQLSQMWIPYYQGEKYSTGEVKGMGLGLSTVASLIWEAGGTCSAYNREDKAGLVIELVVPLIKDIENET